MCAKKDHTRKLTL